jgi:hypothetical protein
MGKKVAAGGEEGESGRWSLRRLYAKISVVIVVFLGWLESEGGEELKNPVEIQGGGTLGTQQFLWLE